jgi:hypothetical protein
MATIDKAETELDVLEMAVKLWGPAAHDSFRGECKRKDRRSVQFRIDLGHLKVSYSATLPHLGCEFGQIPQMSYERGLDHAPVPLKLTGLGGDSHSLVLSYAAEIPCRAGIPLIQWDQVLINLKGNMYVNECWGDRYINEWMKSVAPGIKRKERRASELDEEPVISVSRVHYKSGSHAKKIQTQSGVLATSAIFEDVVFIAFGECVDKIFINEVRNHHLMKLLKNKYTRGSEHKSAKTEFNSMISEFNEEEVPIAPFYIVKDGEEGHSVLSYPADLGCPVSESGTHIPVPVGLTYEQWAEYESLFDKYDAVRKYYDGIDFAERNKAVRDKFVDPAYWVEIGACTAPTAKGLEVNSLA